MKALVVIRRIVLFIFIPSMIIALQSCKKTVGTEPAEEKIAARGKHNPPPPFTFNNCTNPGFSGNFVSGTPANVTFNLNYVNSLGESYPAFTSATVNGITITTPSGTLNVGAGSIRFTANGTPIAAGSFTIPVSIRGSICNLQIIVLNGSISGGDGDPAVTVGSTGSVTFIYQNQTVTYKTVRAADGKIWLQQNLGSPRVATNSIDEASFGHFFQWGRWDDGHQSTNSTTIVGNSSLQNPSHISAGNPAFIKNQTLSLAWWGQGGLSTDTWNENFSTSTNGKNPCAALGTGWRMPTAADWQNIITMEGISDTYNAFQSNLKLPAGGIRFSSSGIIHINGDIGYFWTSSADGSNAKAVFIDNAYGLFILPTERGNAFPCRCVKD